MFNILKKVFKKTNDAIHQVAPTKKKKISKEEFEEILLEADVHYELVEKFLEDLPSTFDRAQAYNALITVFQYKADWKTDVVAKPFVDMIIGVNGAGKTTTIAKLARYHQKNGKSVILGAADTFRAAAIEQLTRWANRLNIPIISTQQGHDPSAVVFDTIASALAKKVDHVLIDTQDDYTHRPIWVKSLKKWYVLPTKPCLMHLTEKCLFLMERKEVQVSIKPKSSMKWWELMV